jgi:hypothetical protein
MIGGKRQAVAIFGWQKTVGIALLYGGFLGADHAQIVKVVDDHRSLFPD